MKELPAYFGGMIDLLTAYLEQGADHFTLQTHGGGYQVGPYVQALQEHDGMLLIEAISNKFLEPPASSMDHQVMLFLGWRLMPEDYLPNYTQFINQSEVSAREIAIKLVQALHFGYGVDDSFKYEIAPPLNQVSSPKKHLRSIN
jgi:hypothetical protein